MALTAEQAEHVRASFMALSRDLSLAGEVFYARLFEIAPATREMFVTDMADQGAKLMSTISIIVSQLHMKDTLRPMLSDLATRHLAYGVTRTQYANVGAALDHMLGVVLTDQYSDEVRDAWMAAYGDITAMMIDAAYGEWETPRR